MKVLNLVTATMLYQVVHLSGGHMPKDRMQQRLATVQCAVQEKNITAPLGQNVTVNCRLPGNYTIVAVNVTRDDLGDKYVLYFRDGQMDPDNQHPFFVNRVQLLINQGDLVFRILAVNSTDEGTYRIRVKYREGRIKTKSICTFNLMTAPASDATTGNATAGSAMTGIISIVLVSLCGGVCLVVGVVIFCLKKGRGQSYQAVTYQVANKLPCC